MIGDAIECALRRLSEGGLVAYPTETVWGLGADATNELALERLRKWKLRSGESPISILVVDGGDLEALGFDLSSDAQRLIRAFWPGPLTLVLPCTRRFARGIARPDDRAVGVRCSSHPVAQRLALRARELGIGPITATSLNRSGEPSVTDPDRAIAMCETAPATLTSLLVPGMPACAGGASTVVDVTGAVPRVLRSGRLEERAIEACLAVGDAR